LIVGRQIRHIGCWISVDKWHVFTQPSHCQTVGMESLSFNTRVCTNDKNRFITGVVGDFRRCIIFGVNIVKRFYIGLSSLV